MARNKISKVYSKKKEPGFSKGGFKFNKNGVPLNRQGGNALKDLGRYY